MRIRFAIIPPQMETDFEPGYGLHVRMYTPEVDGMARL
jgi:hypothetical protein